MNVSLTKELEEFVNRKVASGRYTSASEVVREALRLLEERDRLRQVRLEELRRDLAVGMEQLDRGEYTVYDKNSLGRLVEDVKTEGRERLARPRKSDKR